MTNCKNGLRFDKPYLILSAQPESGRFACVPLTMMFGALYLELDVKR